MVMTMMMATGRLSQILDVGELAALRGAREIRRQLVELVRCRRIAVRLSSLGGVLQVGGDLPGNLLVFRRVRLLKLLELTQHLGERR